MNRSTHAVASNVLLVVSVFNLGACGVRGTENEAILARQVQDLSAKVADLTGRVNSMTADEPNILAAAKAATAAQATANLALLTAQTNSSAIENVTEKVDRMFKREIN